MTPFAKQFIETNSYPLPHKPKQLVVDVEDVSALIEILFITAAPEEGQRVEKSRDL